MEATNQEATTTSHVEENLVVEREYQFTSYVTPLVQQPPMDDTSFHAPMEDRVDIPTQYGLNTLF